MNLSLTAAAALAAALVAAAMPDLFVWAAFTPQAALRSSAALVFGVVMAWAVAIVVITVPLSASLATTITAGIASFLIFLASAAPILVPATFYGFVSTLHVKAS